MEKKYELVKEDSISIDGYKLYRIRALKDIFGNNTIIGKGDLGGYIYSEDNLSHKGDCWVYDDAKVYENALVSGNAKISGCASVYGYARVFGDAYVSDSAEVYDYAQVHGDASIFGCAEVYDESEIFGWTEITGDVRVYNRAIISGGVIRNRENICFNAFIESRNDYCFLDSFGSEKEDMTFFKQKDGSIFVCDGYSGCILDEFKDKVIETHGDNKYAKEYLAMIELIKIKFGIEE